MQSLYKSFCTLCLAECGIRATVENNNLIKVTSDKDDLVSNGYICEKSQKLVDIQNSKDRIHTPMKRVNGKLIDISWDQAISEIACKLANPLQKLLYMAPHSPSYNYNTCYNYELAYNLGARYVTNVFSVEKYDYLLCYNQLFDKMISSDTENADVLLVVGQNPWVTNHYPRARTVLKEFSKSNTKKLIVVDPVDTKTAKLSDIHVKLRPGTDAWFLIGVIKVLLSGKKIKDNCINDIDVLTKYISQFDIRECSNLSGISVDQITAVADILLSTDKVALDSGNGVCHSLNPLVVNYLLCVIFLLTGSYGKSMKPVINYLPQFHTRYFRERATPDDTKLPLGTLPSANIVNNLPYFNCVIIDNNNPVTRFANSNQFTDCLTEIDLVVTIDSFLTETAQVSDYVLPSLTFFERHECVNAMHPLNGVLQISRPIIETQGFTSSEILEKILYSLNVPDNISEYKELMVTNRTEFVDTLQQMHTSNSPYLYFLLKNTIGKQYSHYILSFVWWELYRKGKYSVTEVDKMIAELDTSNSIQYNSNTADYLNEVSIGGQWGSKLTTLIKPSNFVLQCGYRTSTTVNGVLSFNELPKIEVFKSDAEQFNLKDNDIVIVEHNGSTTKLSCKIVNSTMPGLLRITNSKIINYFTSPVNSQDSVPNKNIPIISIEENNGNVTIVV